MARALKASLLAVAVIWVAVQTVAGRPVSAVQGTTVSPGFIRSSLADGQNQQDETVSVRNDYDQALDYTARISGESQVNGQMVPSNQSADSQLVKAISLTPGSFNLSPGNSINVKLTINNSPDLSPGGHYAALVIAQGSGNAKIVGLQGAVSVSIYVVKEGGAVRSITVAVPGVNGLRLSLPEFIDLTFHNTGNVDVVPRGAALISAGNPNNVFRKAVINDGSIPVFTGNDLKVRSKYTELKPIRWPGHYYLTLNYRYDGSDDTRTVKYSFWYIPAITLLYLLIIIVLLILVVRWLKRRHYLGRIGATLRRWLGIKPKRQPPKNRPRHYRPRVILRDFAAQAKATADKPGKDPKKPVEKK